jgi:hypothetical protein
MENREGNNKNRNLSWRPRPNSPARRHQPVVIDYSSKSTRQSETNPQAKRTEEPVTENQTATNIQQPSTSLWLAIKATGKRGMAIAALTTILLIYITWGIIVYAQGPAGGNPNHIPGIFGYISSASLVIPGRGFAHLIWITSAFLAIASLVLYPAMSFMQRFRDSNLRSIIGLVGLVAIIWSVTHWSSWFIPYNAYSNRYDSLKLYQNKQSVAGQEESDSALKQQALQQVILQRYTEKEATKYKITISNDEINKQYKIAADKAGDEDNLKNQLKDFLGWTPEDYKHDIKLNLLQAKLNKKLQSVYKGEADAYKKEITKSTVHIYVKHLAWDNKLHNVQIVQK